VNLSDIKSRLAAATPGPWMRFDGGHIGRLGDEYGICHVYCAMGRADDANVDLIARAPTDLADLVAEVERLRTALDTICGDYVPEILAVEAAERIAKLEAEVERLLRYLRLRPLKTAR
jgi:hypothetical protein